MAWVCERVKHPARLTQPGTGLPLDNLRDDTPQGAELLAADSGLGFLITMGGRVARPDLIVLGMICVGVSGAIIGIIIDYIEKRLLAGIRR